MNEVYVYLIDLPYKVHEAVTPTEDGDFTIYINARLDYEGRVKAYNHAMWHIDNYDFEKYDVGEIERRAHEEIT